MTRTRPGVLTMEDAARELELDGSIRLIDVRTKEEYARGRIPHSINIPLDRVQRITEQIPDRSSRLFVYCLSGIRSNTACRIFTHLGYTNVTNLGGIDEWNGTIERGFQ